MTKHEIKGGIAELENQIKENNEILREIARTKPDEAYWKTITNVYEVMNTRMTRRVMELQKVLIAAMDTGE